MKDKPEHRFYIMCRNYDGTTTNGHKTLDAARRFVNDIACTEEHHILERWWADGAWQTRRHEIHL